LLKALAKSGLPVHIYGSGYERQLYRFKNATYGGEADLPELLHLMSRSRIVLNINANFGAGSHERPFTGMLAGAAVATDFSLYYDEVFSEGEDLIFYRWAALNEGLEGMAALSEDPSRMFDIAKSGHRRAIESHRWANRLDTILAAAEAAKAQLRQ
jgi:spore maturation protein CgeB